MKIEITKEELINDFDKVAKVARKTKEPIYVMVDGLPELVITDMGLHEDMERVHTIDEDDPLTIMSKSVDEQLAKHRKLCDKASSLLPILDFNESEVCKRMAEDKEYARKSVDELYEDYCAEIINNESYKERIANEFKNIGYIEGRSNGFNEGIIYSVRSLNRKGFSSNEISDLLVLLEEDIKNYIASENKQ